MPSSKIQTPIVCQCPWPTVRHGRHVIQSFLEGASFWKWVQLEVDTRFQKKTPAKNDRWNFQSRNCLKTSKPAKSAKLAANLWNPTKLDGNLRIPPQMAENNPLHYGLMSWGNMGPLDSHETKGIECPHALHLLFRHCRSGVLFEG